MSPSTANPIVRHKFAENESQEITDSPAIDAKSESTDRRVTARHDCDGFAEVVVPGTGLLFRGEISNLSEFGCYIKTRAHLDIPRSAQVELRFTVRGDHFSITARAALARSAVGAGFEFTSIEPLTHKSLLRLIADISMQ
jgi:PilZ domain